MKIVRNIGIGLVAVILVGIGAIYATGNGILLTAGWALLFGGPSAPFDPNDAAAAPDYSDPNNWAALPTRDGPEDRMPEGIADLDVQAGAPVDVFFVHPTGYLSAESWTHSMDPDTITEENTQWMLANQASAYNGCCSIYAPRYRQASLFAYLRGEEILEQVLGFAYQDVERAFDYFLANYSNGRPFIVASHSQGTHHGVRLLQDKIDGSPLAERLVAAYIIGGGIASGEFDDMQDVGLCAGATDLGCAVHWDTYSEAIIEDPIADRVGNVCVNPLSWELEGGLAERSMHKGAVAVSGAFQMQFSGSQGATGVVFEPLAAPQPNLLQAQCRNGVLYVSDQTDSAFGALGGGIFGRGNYHGLDYPLFHMDIRENTKLRVATFLSRQQSDGD